MSLLHCSRDRSDRRRPAIAAIAAIAVLALAGCAGTGGNAPSEADRARGEGSPRAAALQAEIPPQALTLYEQATASLSAGDLVEAEFRLEEFLLQYPDYPGAHVNLALVHAQNDNLTAAEDSLTDALLLDPRHAVALNQLGILLRKQGRFDDAEAAYLRAIDAAPGYGLAHYNLGVLYELYLRRLEPALVHFEQYQSLGGADDRVEKWIVDLKRRLAAEQRAANVTE